MKKIHIILLNNGKYLLNYIQFLDFKFSKFDKWIGFDERILFYIKNNYIKNNKDIIQKSLYLKNIKNCFEIDSLNNFFSKLDYFFKNNDYSEELLEETYLFINNYEDIFFDYDLNNKIVQESINYDIEYYYGEGFPEGVIGQVIKASIIKDIIPLVKKSDKFDKNFIFSILLRNISYFDIDLIEGKFENEIFRYSLKLNKKEDIKLIYDILFLELKNRTVELVDKIDNLYGYNLYEYNETYQKVLYDNKELILNIHYNKINDILLNKPSLIRTYPKTIFIEISSQYYSDLIYLPPQNYIKRKKKFLTLDDIKNIYEKNKFFFEDTVIIIDGFGEQFFNKEIIEIINYLSQENEVIVKTTGAFFFSDFTKKLKNLDNIKIIILLDASNEKIYKLVGHKENFKKIETFAKYFLKNYPDSFFIEFTRMKENDSDIEQFYEKWKEYDSNIIFRKYNNFSGVLLNREVADLTPVERFPCFHIRRDFYILSDGKISICKSDFNGEILHKSVFEDSCYNIFESYKNIYLKHITKEYPQICKGCNEFYTFNF